MIDKIKYKTCSKCGKSRPTSEFGVNKQNKDALENRCKSCNSKWDYVHL